MEAESLVMDLLLKVNKDLEHIDRKKMQGNDELVHMSLADVVNLATKLPGLEGVMVSSVMVFGWTYSPAWLGIFALAVADAHSQLQCGEPDSNV